MGRHCRYTPQRCANHWVHGARHADGFARAVRAHWDEILGYQLSVCCMRSNTIENHRTLPLRRQVSLTNDGPNPKPNQASRRTGAWGRGFDKHSVVLLPQALWIGNYTAVTCTPRINETLPRLTRALGCTHMPSFTSSHASSHQKGPSLGRRLATVDAFRLSQVACGAVRQLYAQDTALWQRHCT